MLLGLMSPLSPLKLAHRRGEPRGPAALSLLSLCHPPALSQAVGPRAELWAAGCGQGGLQQQAPGAGKPLTSARPRPRMDWG